MQKQALRKGLVSVDVSTFVLPFTSLVTHFPHTKTFPASSSKNSAFLKVEKRVRRDLEMRLPFLVEFQQRNLTLKSEGQLHAKIALR